MEQSQEYFNLIQVSCKNGFNLALALVPGTTEKIKLGILCYGADEPKVIPKHL